MKIQNPKHFSIASQPVNCKQLLSVVVVVTESCLQSTLLHCHRTPQAIISFSFLCFAPTALPEKAVDITIDEDMDVNAAMDQRIAYGHRRALECTNHISNSIDVMYLVYQ